MDNNVMTAPAGEAVQTNESHRMSMNTHRTTPEQRASATWAEERNRGVDATKAIKQALGARV